MAVKSLSHSSILQPATTNSMLGDYESNYFHHLETVRLGGSAASVTFSNLDQYSDYQHLQIRATGRVSASITFTSAFIRLNGDAASNYSNHALLGTNSSVSSEGAANSSEPYIWRIAGNSTTSGIFSPLVLDILDPFETTKNKTVRSLSGADFPGSNPSAIVQVSSANGRSTNSITSILLQSATGNFLAGSRFSLYGIKARS